MVILVLYRACLLWERGLDTATDWIGEHVGLPSGAILAAKKAAHWPHRLASVSRSYRYACLVNARDRFVICVCPRPGEAMARVRLFAFDPEHGHDAVADAASMPATWWPMQAARVVWRDSRRRTPRGVGRERGAARSADGRGGPRLSPVLWETNRVYSEGEQTHKGGKGGQPMPAPDTARQGTAGRQGMIAALLFRYLRGRAQERWTWMGRPKATLWRRSCGCPAGTRSCGEPMRRPPSRRFARCWPMPARRDNGWSAPVSFHWMFSSPRCDCPPRWAVSRPYNPGRTWRHRTHHMPRGRDHCGGGASIWKEGCVGSSRA